MFDPTFTFFFFPSSFAPSFGLLFLKELSSSSSGAHLVLEGGGRPAVVSLRQKKAKNTRAGGSLKKSEVIFVFNTRARDGFR